MKKFLAIILASGFSRRMERNKLFLKYKNKTFLDLIIEKLLNINFEKVILVVSDKHLLEKYQNHNVNLIPVFNNKPENGISQSIKEGLSCYNSMLCEKMINQVDAYMFFVADQPLLTEKTIKEIINNYNGTITVPQSSGKNSSPVIFPAKYNEELLKLEGDKGGKQIIEKNCEDVTFVNFDDENELKDIDFLEDYTMLIKEDNNDETV